ncbi:LPS translocon maturation chaperone LptM [Thalassotalea eurytherma]
MNKQKVILSVCALLVLSLSGCGLSGDLYQEPPEQNNSNTASQEQ